MTQWRWTFKLRGPPKRCTKVPAGTVSVFETFLEKHGGFIGAH
jgi:hypothetical protein